MAEFGLDVARAAQAVGDLTEGAPSTPKISKKKQKAISGEEGRRSKESKSGSSRKIARDKSEKGHEVSWRSDGKPLDDSLTMLYQEYPDSEEDSSDDEDGFVGSDDRDGLSADALRKLMIRASSKYAGQQEEWQRYRQVTGNVAVREVSIFDVLSPEDVKKLESGQNFGVVLGYNGDRKPRRRGKKGRQELDVIVQHYDFTPLKVDSNDVQGEDDAGEDEKEKELAMQIIYGNGAPNRGTLKKKAQAKGHWPPPPLWDHPPPPPGPPPKIDIGDIGRARASSRFIGFMRQHSNTSSPLVEVSSAPIPPPLDDSFESAMRSRGHSAGPVPTSPNGASASAKNQHETHTAEYKMVSTAGGVIKKNMKKLALRAVGGTSTRHATASQNRAENNPGVRPGEGRYIVASDVPAVVPPPPFPRLPPKDGSGEQQRMQDMELLQMFCEDLYSTAVKLQDKQSQKDGAIYQLQATIQKMDDEIAGLVNVDGAPLNAGDDVFTSLTTSNVYRIERH